LTPGSISTMQYSTVKLCRLQYTIKHKQYTEYTNTIWTILYIIIKVFRTKYLSIP
jgi:hypothetical protein